MSDIKEELAKKASGIRKKSSENGTQLGETVDRIGCEKDFVRLLRADEIECRVSTINERGLSLLLFKDARVDQKILDETFTPFGWKRTHQIIDGNLYCTVEIWDNGKCQWIAKQDVGTTSYSEMEKGQASDSFKRACFNWGVGRALYTAPFIWLTAEKAAIQKKDNKFTTSDRFSVQSISYNEQREIDCACDRKWKRDEGIRIEVQAECPKQAEDGTRAGKPVEYRRPAEGRKGYGRPAGYCRPAESGTGYQTETGRGLDHERTDHGIGAGAEAHRGSCRRCADKV